MTNPKKLYRDTHNEMIGGVCAGLAKYFEIDVTLVRILAVVGLVLWGATGVAYLILWVVVPKEPDVYTANYSVPRDPSTTGSTPGSATGATSNSAGGHSGDPANYPPNAAPPAGSSQNYVRPNEPHTGDPQQDASASSTPAQGEETPMTDENGTGSTPPNQPPYQPQQPMHPAAHGPGRGTIIFGVLLILFGVFAFVSRFVGGISWWNLWPLIIVAAGIIQAVTPSSRYRSWSPLRLIEGLSTITLGAILFGCTTGYVSWNVIWQFFRLWPLLIIGIGLAIIAGATHQKWLRGISTVVFIISMLIAAAFAYTGPHAITTNATFNDAITKGNVSFSDSVPLDGTRDATLSVKVGATQLSIAGGSGDLVAMSGSIPASATKPKLTASYDDNANTASATISDSSSEWTGQPFNEMLDVAVNREVNWDINVDSGVSQGLIDLRNVDVASLALDSGVSNTQVKLGDPLFAGSTFTIKTGVGSISTLVSSSTPVVITSNSGLWGNNVPGFTQQQDGSWANAAYENRSGSSRAYWKIVVNGGVGQFQIKQD